MSKINAVILSCAVIFCASGALNAQEWKLSGIAGVSYSETAVSGNWAGGEKDSRNWITTGEGAAEKDTPDTNWLSKIKLEYGKTSVSDLPEEESADLIYLNSVYTYKFSKYINPYLSFTADTFFTDLFDPAAYTESAGLGYSLIKTGEQELKTRLGAALKQTIYSDADNLSETGAEWITNYELKVNESAKFVSEARLFTAFDAGTDLRWDNGLYVKLGKYLTTQVGYLIIHDYMSDAPRPRLPEDIQTRLNITLGISYNIF